MTRHVKAIAAMILFVGLAWHVSPTCAENVDLSTVPNRNTVQLTIYNSEDLTLVRETRKISFKRGDNPLQFSWAAAVVFTASYGCSAAARCRRYRLWSARYSNAV